MHETLGLTPPPASFGGSCNLSTLSMEKGGADIQGRVGDLAHGVKALYPECDSWEEENTSFHRLSPDFQRTVIGIFHIQASKQM